MIEIIPAIDLIEGRCVRLFQGDFSRPTVYVNNPVDVALRFAGLGIRRLHVVDLDGARSGRPCNIATLESISAKTNLAIDYGGGIRSEADLAAVFDAGATMANIGSLAVRQPDIVCKWLNEFGNERILLGADARGGRVAIDGWQTATDCSLGELLGYFVARGLRQAFVTDVERDGVLGGPSIGTYRRLKASFPELFLIASGGVSSMADIELLEAAGCSGVIIGRAFYEGYISAAEIQNYVSKANYTVS